MPGWLVGWSVGHNCPQLDSRVSGLVSRLHFCLYALNVEQKIQTIVELSTLICKKIAAECFWKIQFDYSEVTRKKIASLCFGTRYHKSKNSAQKDLGLQIFSTLFQMLFWLMAWCGVPNRAPGRETPLPQVWAWSRGSIARKKTWGWLSSGSELSRWPQRPQNCQFLPKTHFFWKSLITDLNMATQYYMRAH